MSVIDDINNELDDHENRIEIIEDSVNTPDEDLADFETETNQAISDLQQNEGQLVFPLTQDTIDLIKSVQTAGGINGNVVMSSGGTFSVPSGFTNFHIRLVGGGQGGTTRGNGGDQAGDYCESTLDLSGTSSVTVTIGSGGGASAVAGGDSSFGSFVVAKGGGSGTTSVGDIIIVGQLGSNGIQTANTGSTSFVQSGLGGSSPLGMGGPINTGIGAGTSAAGQNATGYGGGGGNGISSNSSGGTGGTGTGGICIISW